MNLLTNDLVVSTQQLKQLIRESGCTYSDATVDFLIDKTYANLVPSFTLNGCVKFTDIKQYIVYFFNIDKYGQELIKNNDVDTSFLLTKFKVGDVVYYFEFNDYCLIRGEITSITNRFNANKTTAYSVVGIKRLDEDVDFVCSIMSNKDLFLTLEEATQALLDNTFKLEQKRKQYRYNQQVEDELAKFNNINYE